MRLLGGNIREVAGLEWAGDDTLDLVFYTDDGPLTVRLTWDLWQTVTDLLCAVGAYQQGIRVKPHHGTGARAYVDERQWCTNEGVQPRER